MSRRSAMCSWLASAACWIAAQATGRIAANAGYKAATRFVAELCERNGVELTEESFMRFRDQTTEHDVAARDRLKVIAYRAWEFLESGLRDVRMLVDRALKPYAKAKIRLVQIPVTDLDPIANYVLKSQLGQLRLAQADLCSQYALSLFDLTASLNTKCAATLFRQVPPVIERYFEPTEQRMVNVVIDGLHRVFLARELELDKIWVVQITEVPDEYPVVSLPVRWEDVRPVIRVPANRAKRKFRYSSTKDFPDLSGLTNTEVTEENYLYFFYRDLSALGSSGIRTINESTSNGE